MILLRKISGFTGKVGGRNGNKRSDAMHGTASWPFSEQAHKNYNFPVPWHLLHHPSVQLGQATLSPVSGLM